MDSGHARSSSRENANANARGQTISRSSSSSSASASASAMSSSRGRSTTSGQKLKPNAKAVKVKEAGARVEVEVRAGNIERNGQQTPITITNTMNTAGTSAPSSLASTTTRAPTSTVKLRIDAAYDRLCARGVPGEYTRDVFERSVLGNVGDGLSEIGEKILLMSERLRPGKEQGQAKAKVLEHMGNDGHTDTESAVRGSDYKEETEHEIAYRKAIETRSKAHNTLVRGVKRELGVAQKELGELDTQKRALEAELARKRKILLVMRVVERREGLCVARVGSGTRKGDDGEGKGKAGYVGVIEDLRIRAGCAMRDVGGVLKSNPTFDALWMDEMNEDLLKKIEKTRTDKVWKYTRTRDAFTKLHAAHVRRSRRPADSGFEGDVHKRLDNVLSELSPAGSNEKDLEDMKRKVIELAKTRMSARAGISRVGVSVLHEEAIEVDLECLLKAVEKSEEELQRHVDRASALGWACLEGVDWMSTFRENTAPALSEMLAAHEQRVDGYVERIREGLIGADQARRKKDNEPTGNFINSVRGIVGGVPGGNTDALLEDVRRLVERVQLGERILSLRMERRNEGAGAIADALDVEVNDKMLSSTDRNKRLLERKSAKIAYGMELARDVRAVLEGSKLIR